MTREELLKIAKPVLFNTDMVRAIIRRDKSVTRRCVKPSQLIGLTPDKCKNKLPEEFIKEKPLLFLPYSRMTDEDLIQSIYKSPFEAGDYLYVRETWNYIDFAGEENGYVYKVSDNGQLWETETENWKWRPSIHMPKEAARIFLKVTGVKAERLQNMTVEDAHKEGIDVRTHAIADGERLNPNSDFSLEHFEILWDSTIDKKNIKIYGWNANPFTWVIEFELVEL